MEAKKLLLALFAAALTVGPGTATASEPEPKGTITVFAAASLTDAFSEIARAAVDREMEEAACVEGASQWQLFTTVMLPLGGRALFNGLVIAWARALGEFGATILFAGNLVGRTQTMPLAIYVGFESDMGVALALSVLLVGASSLFLFTLRQLERTRDRINQASG